jgi:hypothetical protein
VLAAPEDSDERRQLERAYHKLLPPASSAEIEEARFAVLTVPECS